MKLRIMTYNIHKGFTTTNTKFVLNQMRDMVRESQADIVFLQEVVGENLIHQENLDDWPLDSQFEFLADEVWDHFAYGKNAAYDHGHHGNAILSKFPILDWKNTNISTNRFESRGCLYAKIEVPGKPAVNLVCLHLDLFQKGRMQQVYLLERFLKEHVQEQEPLIIAGDFNDWSGKVSRELESMVHVHEAFFHTQGRYAKTFPSHLPMLSLDRVFVRGMMIQSAEARQDLLGLSDHIPLVVDLQL